MISMKKITKSGGLSIPVHLRRDLAIQAGDAMDVESMPDGAIVIRPHDPRCVFCGGQEDVELLAGKGVCARCADIIRSRKAVE